MDFLYPGYVHVRYTQRGGGLDLVFETRDAGVAAQLMVKNVGRPQPISIPLKSRSDFRSSKLEGLWWLPTNDTHFELSVYNYSNAETACSISITRADGVVVRTLNLSFAPRQSRTIDLQDLRQQPLSEIGGISIEHNGKPGSLVAAGSIYLPSRQYSATMSFVDPATLPNDRLNGAGVALGRVDFSQEVFSGQLFLRNVSTSILPVTPSLQCGENRIALPDVILLPGAAKWINVPADSVTCDAPFGIEITSPVRGGLVGRWLSIAESSGLVVETVLHGYSRNANVSGSDPWWIDEETTSILYVKNTGDTEAGIRAGHPLRRARRE